MQPTGFFSLIWESLKWKVHYSISSKGCEFQKPEQVTEMGEQGRVEAVISSALAVGWHDKDGFCQGKRWKYSIPFSISCTLRKAEVHTVIPKCLKAIHFSIPLSLQVTLRIMRLFPNNMLFSLQQDNFLHLGKCLKPRPDTLWKFLPLHIHFELSNVRDTLYWESSNTKEEDQSLCGLWAMKKLWYFCKADKAKCTIHN